MSWACCGAAGSMPSPWPTTAPSISRHGGGRDTLAHLDRAGIAHAGAGRNPGEAAAPAWLDGGGTRGAAIAATGAEAEAICRRQMRLSAELGTTLLVRDGVLCWTSGPAQGAGAFAG